MKRVRSNEKEDEHSNKLPKIRTLREVIQLHPLWIEGNQLSSMFIRYLCDTHYQKRIEICNVEHGGSPPLILGHISPVSKEELEHYEKRIFEEGTILGRCLATSCIARILAQFETTSYQAEMEKRFGNVLKQRIHKKLQVIPKLIKDVCGTIEFYYKSIIYLQELRELREHKLEECFEKHNFINYTFNKIM